MGNVLKVRRVLLTGECSRRVDRECVCRNLCEQYNNVIIIHFSPFACSIQDAFDDGLTGCVCRVPCAQHKNPFEHLAETIGMNVKLSMELSFKYLWTSVCMCVDEQVHCTTPFSDRFECDSRQHRVEFVTPELLSVDC